jgi:hypothetical protein
LQSTFTAMQRFLSILFVWVIMFNVLSLSVVQLSFELNRDYIAEFLCIEREKEITVCRGTCFLKDKLKQAEEQQDQHQVSQLVFAVFFTPSYWESSFSAPERPALTHSLFQEKLRTELTPDLFFHPPRL